MKGKISLLTRKVFATIVALAMSIPPSAFASTSEVRLYNQDSSVMGLQKIKEDPTKVENTDETKLTKDLDDYQVEITSKLDESLTKIDYTIKVKRKEKLAQDSEAKLSLSLTKTPNSNINDLKLVSASTDTEKNEPDFKKELEALVLTSKASNEIIYKLSADVNKAKDQRAYDLILGLKENDKKANVFAYSLKTEKGVTIEDNKTVDLVKIVNKEEKITKARGEFKKEGIFGGLFASHDTITWTDYLLNGEKDNKEFTYDLNLDSNQETTDTKIALDYYELTDKGFEINKEFSQAIDFDKKIKFEIPAGYLAKITLKTQVSKKNTEVKEYSLNKSVLKNPIYIEGNKEEKSSAEEDPLPEDKKTELVENQEKTSDAIVKNPTNQDKKEEEPKTKESSTEIRVDDKTAEEKKTADNKAEEKKGNDLGLNAVATDSSGNEIKVVEKNTKSSISPIILNKESLLAKLESEGKLTDDLKTTIEDLAKNLDSYNEEKITDQDLKDFTKALATNKKIEKTDLRFYLEKILSGINKQTNKAANINYDEIITYAYPEKIEENPEEEIKVIDKNSEKSEDQKTSQDTKKDLANSDDKEELKTELKTESKAEIKEKAEKAFENDLAKLKEEASKEGEKKTGVLEGLKSLLGQTDIQKADRELKEALKDESKSLEDIQNLLNSFETKYKLSKADQAKLMDDNGDAIKALVEKDGNENFRPHIFAVDPNIRNNLENKQFHILTRFETSIANGPILVGQYFNIHLDEKLTVNDPNSLKSIYHKGVEIAKPTYNLSTNTINYKIVKQINENLQIPLDIPVDYNPDNITLDNNGEFIVVNKVSGLGVTNPKNLLPQRVDSNGDPAGTIIEPGRKDVDQIIEPDKENYRLDTKLNETPVVKDGKLEGYNWTFTVSSDKDLAELGYRANFTTVKGSGLGEIEKIKIDGKDPEDKEITDQLQGQNGIVDSKHHSPGPGVKSITYTFYTKATKIQERYMFDLSVALLKKNKYGAKRVLIEDGWPIRKVKDATPNRVGMNNRTTVLGEFTANNTTKWTITDMVCTPDKEASLPLTKDRKIDGQTTNFDTYVYKLNDNGEMVVDNDGITGNKRAGTIAVFEKTSSVSGKSQSLAGVTISQNEDLKVVQEWALDTGASVQDQEIKAVDPNKNETDPGYLLTTQKVDKPADAQNKREFTINNVRVWDVQSENNATRITPALVQDLPKTVANIYGTKFKYLENYNYYKPIEREYYILNRGNQQIDKKYGSFTLLKTDENGVPQPGATFRLFRGPEITTNQEGKAKFSNIEPGDYNIIETKAPPGYKLADNVNFRVDLEGKINLTGGKATITGGQTPTATIKHNQWPGYMNAMHYGTIDSDGNITTYIYLKALGDLNNGSTNKPTKIDIYATNANITGVGVFDVNPNDRPTKQREMNLQTVNTNGLSQALNIANQFPIKGYYDAGNTKKYTIELPNQRVTNNWGFMVKITAKKDGNGQSTPGIKYDWKTNNGRQGEAELNDNNIALSSENAGQETTITIKNEPFERKSVKVYKVRANKKDLAGATFVLKDADGNPIKTVVSNEKGLVDFGDQPEGTYTIEEIDPPDGYIESQLIFDVTVDKAKQVSYNPRFKHSNSEPVKGVDYWIENEVVKDDQTKAKIIKVNQEIKLSENGYGEIGTRTGVWEAYGYESYTYKANIELEEVTKDKRFEIQFDPNLDLTQYVNKIPSIYNKEGQEIAKPYMDYQTNLLTYVFTDKASGQVKFDLTIDGIIPSKFYAKTNGKYNFEIVAGPGLTSSEIKGNTHLPFTVEADYGIYDQNDSKEKGKNQAYYFREVYKDGEDWYVKAIAYVNPMSYDRSKSLIRFNWMTTDWDPNKNIVEWPGKGYSPAFELNEVKIYKTYPGIGRNPYTNGEYSGLTTTNAMHMPLSMGVRPENDPQTYQPVYSSKIDPNSQYTNTQNGIKLTYDPRQIDGSATLNTRRPLLLDMPVISNSGEGYVVEQTFRVTDLNMFRSHFRAFYMASGGLQSAFASKVNTNVTAAEQTKQEIPKFYTQKVMMANEKYTPGKFRIKKYSKADQNQPLAKAIFSLEDANKNKIFRSTDDKGELSFDNIKPGTYILREEEAPDNFIKSDKIWQVYVAKDGTVTITEFGLGSTGDTLIDQNPELKVSNKPKGTDFKVYKRDEERKPLPGAEFTIKKKDSEDAFATGTSDEKGVVKFSPKLTDGTYILEESKAPTGYKKLDKKWVLVVKEDKVKVYDYVKGNTKPTSEEVNSSVVPKEDLATTKRVEVKRRSPQYFSGLNDPRWRSWTENSVLPYKLGTRIIAINKTKKYVVQRYVINPEGNQINKGAKLQIHRQPLNEANMDWYAGTEDVKVFTLNRKVTEEVEDVKLANYVATIQKISPKRVEKPGETPYRLDIDLPETNMPIVVDVKIPYKDESASVGTGGDYFEKYDPYAFYNHAYWKPDYYEHVSDIPEGEALGEAQKEDKIIGAYISEGSLDLKNEKNRHKFKFKKTRENGTDALSGATFKLTGPKKPDGKPGQEYWSHSGEDGKVDFKDLLPGTYKLEETGSPQGYENANTEWTVTIKDDGKVYIKDINPTNQVTDNDPETKWQNVKVNEGTKENQSVPSRDEYKPNAHKKLTTNIVEVNQETKKMRQVFLLNRMSENLNNPELQIHAQPEDRNITDRNTKIISIREVGNTSEINNPVNPGKAVPYRVETIEHNGFNRLKINTDVTGAKALEVTIETDIPNSGRVGTGMDFKNYTNTYWAAESYASKDAFVLDPVKESKVDKNSHLIIGDKDRSNQAQASLRKAQPVSLSPLNNTNGIMTRSLEPTDIGYTPISPRSLRSAFFAADGLEMSDNSIGTPVGAGNLSQTSYNIDSSDANISVTAGDVNTTDGTRNINISVSPKDTGGQPGKETIIGNKIQMVFVIDRSKDISAQNARRKGTLDQNINKLIYDIVQKAKDSNASIDATFIEYDRVNNAVKGGYNQDLLALDARLNSTTYNMATPSNPNGADVTIKDYLGAVSIKDRDTTTVDGNKSLATKRDNYFRQITNTTKTYDKRIFIDISNFNTMGADKWNVGPPGRPEYKYQAAEIIWPFRDVGNPPHFDTWMAQIDQTNYNLSQANVKAYNTYMNNNTANASSSNNNVLQGHFFHSLNTNDYNSLGVNNIKDFFDRNVITDDNFVKERIPAADDPNAILVKNAKIDINLNTNIRLAENPSADNGKISYTTGGFSLNNINLKKGQTLNLSYKIGLDNTAQSNQDYQIHRTMLYTPNNSNPVNLDNNLATRRNLEHYFVTLIANNGSGQTTRKSVNKGEYYTLTQPSFAPPSGQEFDYWLVFGQKHQPGDEIQITEDTNVIAFWKNKPVTPSVTITFDGNGSQSKMDPVTVDKGSTYYLPGSSFTPPANSAFDAWSVNGERKNPGDPIDVNDNTIVTAIWKPTGTPQPKKFKITTSVNDPNLGSVSVDKDKASEGEDVTVTVTPKDSTVEITEVRVGRTTIGPQLKPDGTYTFPMEAKDVHISVTFNKKEVVPKVSYDIGVDTNYNGKKVVVYTRTAPNKSEAGQLVEFTVTPFDDYEITSVYVKLTDGSGRNVEPLKQEGNKYSFTMPNQAVNIYANVKYVEPPQGTYLVGINPKITGGSVTADPRRPYPNTVVRIKASPNQGMTIDTLSVTKQWGGSVDVKYDNDGPYFIMPDQNVTVSATFKEGQSPDPDPGQPGGSETQPDDKELGWLIYDPTNPDKILEKETKITNKKAGIELNIFKRTIHGRPLEGAEFKLEKTESDYKTVDKSFPPVTGVSDGNGQVVFKRDGKIVKLEKGYYTLEEVTPPLGFKKATSKWRVEVKDDKEKMHATYIGPKQTPSQYLDSKDAELGDNTTNSNLQIRTASRITHIDTTSKTFVQRTIIDLRGYKGQAVNVQIKPNHPREEIDRPGVAPVTIKEGVKTAYRTTYEITNAGTGNLPTDDILKNYDLSKDGVKMVNTARWRPFDWGFDEDQLNLEPGGVYFIDIEGYYDNSIIDKTVTNQAKIDKNYNVLDAEGNIIPDKQANDIKPGIVDPYERDDIKSEDLAKLHIDFKLYQGKRVFQQLKIGSNGRGYYEAFDKASYQGGAAQLTNYLLGRYGKTEAENWSGNKPAGNKYANYIGKKVKIGDDEYETGRIYPSVGEKVNPIETIATEANISSLYTTGKGAESAIEIPKEGLDITNEEESYNITFSKHGRDDPSEGINSQKVTNNRLEGAIFKLQYYAQGDFIDLPGTYVSSAFNGFFGFRGLKPGRYRLMEVQAPPGYRPINDAILQFTIAYTDKEITVQDPKDPSKNKIIPRGGYITLEYDNSNSIVQYAEGNAKGTGQLVDFVTSATAKNMGKIINEKPGKGKVTIEKKDDDAKLIPGAEFKLTRLSKTLDEKEQAGEKPPQASEEGKDKTGYQYTGTVNKDGKLVFDKLPIGQYRLEEIKPAPGHINTGQIWHFTVGGKDLDPYAGDIKPTGEDLGSKITMTSKMNVKKPDQVNDKTTSEKEIHPNLSQMLDYDIKFNLDKGTVINPGDYFTVKLPPSIDLKGIFKTSDVDGLDIFADGVGTIAKATYDYETGEITYTFTEYAKTYQLVDFKTDYTAHINTNNVPQSKQNVEVGIGIKKSVTDSQPGSNDKTINVVYERGLRGATVSRINGIDYQLNLASKITEFDPKTGRFTQIVYVNPNGMHLGTPTLTYYPGEDIDNVRVEAYQTDISNGKLDTNMPESYSSKVLGLDNKYPAYNYFYSRLVNDSNPAVLRFGRTNASYIVRITGNVYGKDKSSYRPTTYLRNYYDDGSEFQWAYTYNEVFASYGEATAKAELTISAINPKNRILFKKVDQGHNPLAGAKFKLKKLTEGTDTKVEANWTDVEGSEKTTPETGVIEYNTLTEGKYALVEVSPPTGFNKIEGHIQEFEVLENGTIIRLKEPTQDKNKPEDEIIGIEPTEIVNYKDIEFVKIDAADGTRLEGGEFEVYYKEKEEDKEYKPYKIKNAQGKEETMTAKSGKDGKFNLNIYKNGYYALKETKAPDGYAKLPGYIREFKLDNGKVQVLEKDPFKASYLVGKNNLMEARILEIDKEKGTFKQRIIINQNHNEWKFDTDTHLRIFETDDFKIATDDSGKRKVKAAVLKAGQTLDSLTEKDYKDAIARANVNDGIIKYTVRDLYGTGNYTGPETGKSILTTKNAIVLEYEGKLDKGVTTQTIKSLIQADLTILDEVSYNFDMNQLSKKDGKGIYVDKLENRPIEVENRKVELPKAFSTQAWIGFTIGGLALMIAGAYIYHRRKMALDVNI
ncbi:SpaA isopeptide-forming pilin-related protein [uncultured Anaerococcus sp.]|uniref:SpaA isopeptide-forming pilin-related protein n=1 Tax=uncultured Anaerococcus sp. TaxID=293428 RepID=UPI002889E9C9|nr:SpaA isopeptide-forming pilin-related protein [uncultured Anaerococcus sp.]